MQVTSDGNTFNLVVGPAHFARDDFAVLANPNRMALRVTILDVDGGGERVYSFPVNFPETVVQALILFGLAFDFTEQVMAVDPHGDVTSQGGDRFQILFRELLTTRFLIQQNDADEPFMHDEWH